MILYAFCAMIESKTAPADLPPGTETEGEITMPDLTLQELYKQL